jgi:ribosomal protein S3AE
MAAPGKKHWVPVLAPNLFKNEELGQSYVLETDSLKGRGISVNLMNLVSEAKKTNLTVSFRIVEVKEGKAFTRVTGISMQPGIVKRLVRRGRTKVDDSFLITLKHGQVARVKPMLITKAVVNNTIAAGIRHRVREVLAEVGAEHTFETLIQDVVGMKLQRYLKHAVNDVYPLRSVDIRVFELQPKFALDVENEAEPSTYASGITDEPAAPERG